MTMMKIFSNLVYLLLFSIEISGQSLPWVQLENQESLFYQELRLRNPKSFVSFESYPYDWKFYLQNQSGKTSFEVSWNKYLNDKYKFLFKDSSDYLGIEDLGYLRYGSKNIDTKPVRLSNRLNGFGNINKYLVFSTDIQMDTDASLDNDYRGRTVNAVNDSPIQGFLIHSHAYLKTEISGFEGMFGKQKLSWGPSITQTMILSDNIPALDQLWFRYTWKSIRLTHFWAQMDHSVFDSSQYFIEKTELTRNLFGTRVEFKVTENLNFGISQTMIFPVKGFGFKLDYLNPLISFFGERQNTGISELDDNITYETDLSYRQSGLNLFTSILIDDYSLDGTVGNKLGFQIGGEISDPLLNFPATFSLEFTKINPKTYTVKSSLGPVWLNYVYYSKMNGTNIKDLSKGSIIGHPNGPDSWQLYFRNRIWNWYPFWFETEAIYKSFGLESSLLPINTRSKTYDIIQTESIVKIASHYDYENYLKASVFLIYDQVKNPEHISGKTSDVIFGLNLSFDLYYYYKLSDTFL